MRRVKGIVLCIAALALALAVQGCSTWRIVRVEKKALPGARPAAVVPKPSDVEREELFGRIAALPVDTGDAGGPLLREAYDDLEAHLALHPDDKSLPSVAALQTLLMRAIFQAEVISVSVSEQEGASLLADTMQEQIDRVSEESRGLKGRLERLEEENRELKTIVEKLKAIEIDMEEKRRRIR